MNNDFVYVDGEVPFFQSRLFLEYGVKHAFFTKKGGVSGGVFQSLNFAEGIGELKDSWENVKENHYVAAKVFGLDGGDICRSVQIHTNVVETAEESDRGKGIILPQYDHGVDGMVTFCRNLLLSVRSADCVPVLLCHKGMEACAAVHAGWRGTVGGIAKNAVEIMEKKGINPRDIIAAIGPCIGKCCYEVGQEVFGKFVEACPEYSRFFTAKEEKYMLDLTFANRFILESAGIPAENISSADLCTCCDDVRFFSHRRQGTARGTMSAMIHI